MKRIYIPFMLIAVIVTAGMMTGCKKDFLEKPNGGDVTVDTIFHTQKQAQYAVADMYNWCVPTGFVMNNSADSREDVLTDQVHLLLPGAAWVAGNLNYQYYIAAGMAPAYSIDRGPITQRGNTAAVAFVGWYKSIRKANLVLKSIDKVGDASPEWISDVKGQAIFCRAMAHYSAFRLYGGIPLVAEVLGEGKVLYQRAAIQSVVDTLVKWCDMAAALLPPTRPSNDYGKVTSLAALALKARVLLYAASPLYNTPADMKAAIAGARYNDGRDTLLCYETYSKERWKRAADAAKAVIDAAGASGVVLYNTGKPATTVKTDNYAGLGDYEAVCNNVMGTTGTYGNPEMILVNTYNQNDPNRDGWADWGRYNTSKVRQMGWGAKNDVPVEFLEMYEKKDGTKWTATPTGTDFKTYWEGLNLDPRAYQCLAWAGQWYNGGKTFLAYYKGTADGTTYVKGGLVDDTNAGDNTGSAIECSKFVARVDNNNDAHFAWPVFRLAEFYLSYAEALNEYAGPSADAFTYLNLVRQRAGMPDKTAAMLPDQIAFRTAIQNERSIELAFEDHRYNDLHRWLTAHVVLNKSFRGFAVTASTNGFSPKPTNPFLNWSLVSYGSRNFPVNYYYVPFPLAEVSMRYLGGNTWDGQNPGWQ